MDYTSWRQQVMTLERKQVLTSDLTVVAVQSCTYAVLQAYVTTTGHNRSFLPSEHNFGFGAKLC